MSNEKHILISLKQLDIGATLLFEVSGKTMQAAMNNVTAYEPIIGVKVSQEAGILVMGSKGNPVATPVIKITLLERDPDFVPERPERKNGPKGPQYILRTEATEICKQRIARALAKRDTYWLKKAEKWERLKQVFNSKT